MEIMRTINADVRYYPDEDTVQNADSLIRTMEQFNDMKMQLYNQLYDKKYFHKGALVEGTYSAWLKERFSTSDYYNCAVYTTASGILSSQQELHRLYIKGKSEDVKNRGNKITFLRETLSKRQAVRDSIRAYARTGRWAVPYKGCRIRVTGKNVTFPTAKVIPLADYERTTEAAIRGLKTRIKLMTESMNRASRKLKNLEQNSPKRVIFGTRKYYSEKDNEDTDMNSWKSGFYLARHNTMSLPGRHTSKDCNFLVSYAGNQLRVRCMDGRMAVFKGFRLARYHDVWKKMLSAGPKERRPVCYNFTMKKDKNNRTYFIVSVSVRLENQRCNESVENGCIAMDLNYDHVALSELDRDGNRISGKVIHFSPLKRSTGQISDEIGRVMAMAGGFCTEKKKPLIMEDINTFVSRHTMRYGNAKRNLHASVFAYGKMTACIQNQAFKQGFGIFLINPAYTSQIGKHLYLRQKGLSIHEAASYVIGLKGMNLLDRLTPDQRMYALVSDGIKAAYDTKKDMSSLMAVWKCITAAFKKVPTHSFYKGIPYEVLNGKKKPTLKTLANAMKDAYVSA